MGKVIVDAQSTAPEAVPAAESAPDPQPEARPKRVVVVGGVAAGMSAATRLRRLDERAGIVVLERGGYVSFANCGLPYYVGGVIEDRSALLLQTPESLAARFRLDVRVGHEVVSIDPAARTVAVLETVSGRTDTLPYDALVLASGSIPRHDLAGGVPVHTLWTVDDVDAITAALQSMPADAPVVVVGGGYVGLEAVDNLARRGLAVTLVQHGAHPLAPLDPEMAAPVLTELQRHGVTVLTGRSVESVGDGLVRLDDGRELPAVLVVEARGVLPDVRLATEAGIEIGPAGGIVVDSYQRTSDASIWAAGDAVEKVDGVDGAHTLVALAGLANRHGRAAADAIHGVGEPSVPALGTSIVGVFDVTVAMLGWNERRLRAAGRAHRIVHTHPSSHAGYYPGAQSMAIKLLIDADSDRILGAQIVGRDGVDKRIDVLATAMAGGLTASDLSRLELAYAPQYGSAKDAVNLTGYAAENVASGTTRTIQWHEVEDARRAGATVLDVRTVREFERGHIPHAVNVPLDELRDRPDEIPGGPLVVHCQVGQRGHAAVRLLAQLGHDARNLDGGWVTWSAGREVLAPD